MNIRSFLYETIAIAIVSCLVFFSSPVNAQVPNANSFSSQINYTGNYRYGVNQGYYPGWSSVNTATIAAGSVAVNVKGVGVKSFRIPLYDDFLSQWGLTVEVGNFQSYLGLSADDNTAFVGSPSSAHRDPATYPGSPEQSKTFANLYEPIWLDAAQTQINPNNYYAKYLYDVVSTYGQYIRFWEVVNEPDFTYSSAGWSGDMNPPLAGSWFDHNPTPDELVNLRAPFQYYIRMLRISWEVIKKLQPNDYVCIGGIGYRDFLDAILRNTDNPVDGSVTSQYPNKGGAYFDVVSFHCYPMYNLSVGNRHSDQAATSYINFKNALDNLAANYGYNGSQYPKKQFICTETGVSRIMSGNNWGSNDGQKNYLMKASVLSQKNAVRQVYWFSLGDGTDGTDQYQRMGLYNYFGGNTPYNQTPSDQGIAMKTTSDLLYGKTYDAARTTALSLPSSVEGAAFRANDGTYTYVLWAKTSVDLSETASATYNFPSTVIMSTNVVRKEWDYSQTNSVSTISKSSIVLTGTPSFFTEANGNTAGTLTANAGANQIITLPQSSMTLSGSGTAASGNYIAFYQWSQSSGPSTASFSSPYSANPVVSGLVQGSYVFTLKVTDNLGASATGNVTVTVNGSSGTTTTTTRIEAENYTNMSGVVKEATTDVGGGQDVGYIDTGDWMDYSVAVSSAGTYGINLRVASPNGGQLQIKNSSGTVLATVTIPNTGGWQNWQTVSANISLSAGSQTIRIYSASNGWNFNWFEIVTSTTTTPPPSSTIQIEAENYTNMSGVVKETTTDAGGGQDIGYIDTGDWMDYNVNVSAAGTYQVNLRVASPTGGQLQIKNSTGNVLATVSVPATGGWQSWQTVTANITLPAGAQMIRIYAASNGWNFNWFEIAGAGTTPPPPPPSGSAIHIEAENYNNMSGVVKETTTDAGGGQDVGYIDNGDWMDYNITPGATGTYGINLRVASPNGGQLQVKSSDGTVLASVTVPNTGGWQSWQTVSANISLQAGSQTIRIYSLSNGWNFNWMDLISNTGSVTMQSITKVTETIPSLSIYPNPVVNDFQLQINNDLTGQVSVQVYDMQGALQKQFSLSKPDAGSVQYYLSIGQLAKGDYIIKATMNGWTDSKQIVKQ